MFPLGPINKFPSYNKITIKSLKPLKSIKTKLNP